MPRPRINPKPLDDPHKPVNVRAPMTMKEAKDTLKGGSQQRRRMIRSNEELREPVWFQLRVDATSHELLRIHALMRRVRPTTLYSDILNAWLANSTDYSQALVREMLPRGARAAVVPERWVGYLASLGYAPPLEEQLPPDPPDIPEGFTPRRHDDLSVKPPEPPDDLPVEPPPVEPQAPAPAPSEVKAEATQPDPLWDPRAHGAKPFDPEEYAREAGIIGHGSGAANVSAGLGPDGMPL